MGREAAIASLGALQMKDPGIRLAAETAMILEDPVTNVQPSISENPDRYVLCFSWSYSAVIVVNCVGYFNMNARWCQCEELV